MYHRLKSFLDENNILFKSLDGFREKRSTQHAILNTVNIIQNNMNLKLFNCGIFIDLKKAFDTVDHAILRQKRGFRGIPPSPITSNRSRFRFIFKKSDLMWCYPPC